MKGRIVKIQNNKSSKYILFDRCNLVGGSTKNGINIPSGGVILNNNILGGYINTNTNNKKWKIIGKLMETNNVPNINISKVQNGGDHKSNQENEINQ